MLADIVSAYLENQYGPVMLPVPDQESAVRCFAEKVADWAFPDDPGEATGWILDFEDEVREEVETGILVVDVEGNLPSGPAFSIAFAA